MRISGVVRFQFPETDRFKNFYNPNRSDDAGDWQVNCCRNLYGAPVDKRQR